MSMLGKNVQRCTLRTGLALCLLAIQAGATATHTSARPIAAVQAAPIRQPASVTTPKQNHTRLTPDAQAALAAAQPDDRLYVIVRLSNPRVSDSKGEMVRSIVQPYLTLSRLDAIAQRGSMVTALQAEAGAAQQNVMSVLQSPEFQAQADHIRSFWIFNGLALRATPAVIRALAERGDVESIQVDEWRRWVQSEPITHTPTITNFTNLVNAQPSHNFKFANPISMTLNSSLAAEVEPPASGAVTWGVGQIRANQVWNGLGVNGAGIVVASIDSGVDWQHPALRTRYRGYGNGVAFDHQNNWFDTTDEGSSYPVDQESHGTHTMGTIVGLNGVGVAPGALWMACKGLNGNGYGLSSWLHACFQFLLAPNNNPANAPDVVNNSWGSDDGGNNEFRDDVIAMRAAGIFTVFSAGNSGPKPGTVGSPGSFPESIAVGATDSEDEVAYFSSRGPSPIGGIVRPAVSAPGVRVVSTVPGGVYKTLNGTSMAAPHVAGAAALLLSAKPSMDIAATLYTLTSTAVPLSTTIPNNDSGYGRIDVYNAVLSILETGVITGTVYELGGAPIAGALVTATGSTPNGVRKAITTTNAAGHFVMQVPFGMYTASAGAFGFNTSAPVGPRLVITKHVVEFDVNLVEMPTAVVRGRVENVMTNEAVTATVRALGTPKQSLAINGCPPCRYSLDLPAGNYVLEARATGYLVQTRTLSLVACAIVDMDFDLVPVQRVAFVDSGAWYYGSQAGYFREALDALHWAYDEYRIKQIPRDTPTITELLKYDTVVWSAPYDSPGLVGAGKTISEFLGAGKNLMLTGQDVAFFDAGGTSASEAYFLEKISAYVDADDSGSREIQGVPNTLLAGKILTITGGDGADNQEFPDVVGLLNANASKLIGTYRTSIDADPNGAGVYADVCVKHKVAFYSFGFEAINSLSDRIDVLSRTLSAFAQPRPTIGVDLISRDDFYRKSAIGLPGSVVTHVVRVRNIGQASPTSSNLTLSVSGQHWPTQLSNTFLTLKACASTLVTMTTSIPLTATMNDGDEITLTAVAEPIFGADNATSAVASSAVAASAAATTATASLAFLSKTPANILLVDDERFSKSEGKYLEALASRGNLSVDRWDTRQGVGLASSPPITVLKQYSMVIWYNGYDWFDPVSVAEQNILRQYLQGGGRLFLSSQSMLQYTEANAFDRQYLGIGTLDFNDVISRIVGAPGNPIGDGLVGDTLLPFPYNWNLSTAVQPMSGTQVVLRSNSGQPAGLANIGIMRVVAGGQPAQWKTVFMPFAFETLSTTTRVDLMNRVVGWLSWLGDSSLVANTSTVNIGTGVVYTLTLRADANMPSSPTQTVMISVPVAPGLQVISSTLAGFTADNAGSWAGVIRPGEVMTWQFGAVVTTPPQPARVADPLTATLSVAMSPAALHWTHASAVYLNAPQIQTSYSVNPASPVWGGSAVLKLVMRNTGSIPANSLRLTVTVPTGLTLGPASSIVLLLNNATPIPSALGESDLAVQGRQIVWQGSLQAGGELEMSYPISVPRFSARQPLAFFNSVRIEVGGMAQQAETWLVPGTGLFRFPILMRNGRP